MPKMTAKYSGAIQTAHNAGLPAIETNNQEELYTLLQENGYFWDSKVELWEYHVPEDADDPTPLIMIRVWAEGEIIEEAADDLASAIKKARLPWLLIERSQPYGNRPPKQREARIYLKFLPEKK
ncbi:MAG: hypothetical protein KDI79_15300 [Anaerolineae bacterium]|nr:hypothetical protein [Anaerolineae bacterium]